VRRTPILLQQEATECGAASLGIVLAHYGRFVTLEELRVACGVSRDGSNAGSLLKAARRYGMEAKGFRKEPEQLESMPLPVILHWNFNHFLVLEGFSRRRAFLNDPAQGRRVVSREELDAAFTGVALQLRPGEGFTRGGERPGIAGALLQRLRGAGGGLLFAVLAGLALVIPGLVLPTFSRVFVDDVLVGGKQDWLRPLLLGLAATAVVRGLLSWLRQRCLLRLETKLAVEQSGRFLWHVLHLPIRFFASRHPADIASRVQLNDTLARLLSGRLATTALDLVMVVFFGALMLDYDAHLALVAFIAAAGNLAALRLAGRKREAANVRLLQLRGKLAGVSAEGIRTVETLKASGAESDFFARWAGHHANLMAAEQQFAVYTYLLSVAPALLGSVATAGVLVLGGYKVMGGELSMGMLVAFQTLMGSFLGPTRSLVSLGSELQEVRGNLVRLDDVLRHPLAPLPADRGGQPTGPGRLEGALELDGLEFGYNPTKPPLISGFDLCLRPGARVALVGGSGSGKSTLARLIAGLYEPWQGRILFDGEGRQAVPRSLLTCSVALVDQNTHLFEGTTRDNLTLWDPTISDADVVRAARDAAVHELISHRPGGYDGHIEEGGRNFSGGQRQQLELARALAGTPSILLLDEATAALDPVTEQAVDRALRRRGCTCVIVAHRLSTIRDCDEIIVLDGGRVVQRGTHDELVGQPGAYARLLAATA